MQKPNSKKIWLFTAAFIVGLVLLLAVMKFLQIKAAIEFGESFPESSETVETIVATSQMWSPAITVTGEVRAERELDLNTELPGVIERVGFAPGALVEQGSMLLQQDLRQHLAELQAAEAELALASADFERLSKLKNPDAVSRQQVDRAKAQLEIAQARKNGVQDIITRKTIRAPFTGFTSLQATV